MKLVIKDHKAISWNKLYSSPHWTKRKELAEEIHMLVFSEVKIGGFKPIEGKVDVKITAYLKRPIDSDNICAKLYIDGLKQAGIIKDDTNIYIDEVTTKSVKDKEDYVIIELCLNSSVVEQLFCKQQVVCSNQTLGSMMSIIACSSSYSQTEDL